MAAPATWTVSAALLSRRKTPVPVPTSEAYENWSLPQLKLECTARKLNVVKNTNKEGRIALLNAYDNNKKAIRKRVQQQRSDARRGQQEEEKRTKNCMFRLLNVLFSERFFHAFLTSGDQLSRRELDQGGSTFWENIATAFSEDNVEFDALISPDDPVFEDIRASQTVAHSAAKLHKMWREVSGNFARAEAGSKKSGEHGDDFWEYCGGRADVFYLHQWCNHRGAGREFCSANIYSDDEDDSQKEGTSRAKKGNRKRRNSSQAEVLAALADSVGAIAAANETSEAQEATWKEQALLLHDKRISHRLSMLSDILKRTNSNILELKTHILEHEDDSDEDEFDAESLLAQERGKRQKLRDQILELECEVIANVNAEQVI
ncbi:hypothetical protein AM587_10003582 [Phytophthora nicotianae]|uniref:Uncharacterized protein n=2 Tax=Phytophthora nicotianae TaxID=4792 RepID=A0A0W8DY88_PHYNI|nr:hypothetical protein AM587_10000099 [Phytophthora nicotianae]KUF75995.1 hypothetical protein AM587_10007408 [Phytophthora nicotianae]KUF84762.1 hypothetical protein AM587_10002206 [Phytophthora nicotianae]KUF87132.1 hypothetical protein AM587_10002052 [Phytophthora nicotianae]KUG01294.1 hypothetical protein AM587_10003582 [Phytophthora nicotianae]